MDGPLPTPHTTTTITPMSTNNVPPHISAALPYDVYQLHTAAVEMMVRQMQHSTSPHATG